VRPDDILKLQHELLEHPNASRQIEDTFDVANNDTDLLSLSFSFSLFVLSGT
jgi:hypothetical protein